MQQFQVNKQQLNTHRLVEMPARDSLADGEVKVKIEKFAFTANNITYGVMGEQLNYWQFFPAINKEPEWGVLPVWGFAEVTDSTVGTLPVGDRLFGYFPPASELTMLPTNISDERFTDGSTHRTELPAVYNTYRRVNAEPGYDQNIDELRMLLFPLHVTSFCLWDYLKDNDWFEAEQVLILSASSKTSVGLAYALYLDQESKPVSGLTSAQNLTFVSNLGYYDQVHQYAEVKNLDADVATVIVDMSGNQNVLGKLHQHYGANMKRTINVGITHWEEPKNGSSINIDRSEIFFAPGHVQKRLQDWGPNEFERRSSEFLIQSIQSSVDWMKVTRINGLAGLAEVYPSVCEGDIPAEQGLVVLQP